MQFMAHGPRSVSSGGSQKRWKTYHRFTLRAGVVSILFGLAVLLWSRPVTLALETRGLLTRTASPQVKQPAEHGRVSPHEEIVGYFPQWGVYRNYFVGNLVQSGSAPLLTQLDYAQGAVRNNECAVADPQADMNLVYTAENSVDGVADDPAAPLKGNFHQMQKLHARYPKMRMLISLEGKAAMFAAAAQPDVREHFVHSCIDRFIHGHLAPGVEAPRLFQGFDVDWEYPRAEDEENFVALLAEFRKQMNAVRPGLKLAIAVGGARDHFQPVHWARVAPLVDQVGIMGYDYHGPWNRTTGLISPLYSNENTPDGESVDSAVKGYMAGGVPANKLLMGVPFYAYQWDGVAAEQNGMMQSGHPIHEDWGQGTIQELISAPGSAYKVYRDAHSQTPWIFDGDNFYTYEDAISLREKSRYARRQHLGGVMIWDLSNDTAHADLLRALQPEMQIRNMAYATQHK